MPRGELHYESVRPFPRAEPKLQPVRHWRGRAPESLDDRTMISRRRFMAGVTGLASGAALAGLVPAMRAAAAAPPYPVLPGGRLMAHMAVEYENAMLSGGPGKDGIPAIDRPEFWSADEAGAYLDDGDVVFGLAEADDARAYPQRILVWHEIVNEVIADRGVAVTYCPLTGTAIAFEREGTEFGVSGRLVNSNLVMYDRDTDTWFPQVLAVGIRGPHTGAALVERPLVWTTWQRWRTAYPQTRVLSTDTGFARNYRRDPYGAYNPPSGYYAPGSRTIFPLMNADDRFPPKTVFLGARTEDAAVAFRLETLREEGRLELEANGGFFTAIHDPALDTGYVFSGRTDARADFDGFGPQGVSWVGGEGLDYVNAFEAMWFAWVAFYPQSAIHD